MSPWNCWLRPVAQFIRARLLLNSIKLVNLVWCYIQPTCLLLSNCCLNTLEEIVFVCTLRFWPSNSLILLVIESWMAYSLYSPDLFLQALYCLPVLLDSVLMHLEFLVNDVCHLCTCPFDIQHHLRGLGNAVVEDLTDQMISWRRR